MSVAAMYAGGGIPQSAHQLAGSYQSGFQMNPAGGDALGALAQLGNQSIGQSIGYGISATLASDAWDRQKNLLTRQDLYRRQSLEKAGYNPLLAIMGPGAGPSNARAPQGAQPSAYGAPNMTTHSARSLMAAQMALAGDQSAAARAAAQASLAQAQLSGANVGLTTQNARSARAAADWAEKRLRYYNEHPEAFNRWIQNESSPNSWAGAASRAAGSAIDTYEEGRRKSNEADKAYGEKYGPDTRTYKFETDMRKGRRSGRLRGRDYYGR